MATALGTVTGFEGKTRSGALVQAKVLGLNELRQTLRGLTFKQQKGAMQRLLRAAAEPIRGRIEALAPRSETPPHLAENIVVRDLTEVADEIVMGKRKLEAHEFGVSIGPTRDFFYGWFIEHGFMHYRGSFVDARPFMRPGFDDGQAEAYRILQHGITPIVTNVVRAAGGGAP